MADVRERAVERDSVADINVEAVFPVGLVDSVIFCQRERLPLLTITYQTHMYRSTNKEKKKNTLKTKTPQTQKRSPTRYLEHETSQTVSNQFSTYLSLKVSMSKS